MSKFEITDEDGDELDDDGTFEAIIKVCLKLANIDEEDMDEIELEGFDHCITAVITLQDGTVRSLIINIVEGDGKEIHNGNNTRH